MDNHRLPDWAMHPERSVGRDCCTTNAQHGDIICVLHALRGRLVGSHSTLLLFLPLGVGPNRIASRRAKYCCQVASVDSVLNVYIGSQQAVRWLCQQSVDTGLVRYWPAISCAGDVLAVSAVSRRRAGGVSSQ